MEYVVLARKLRPMRFRDLVGQETVVKALQNAIQTERVAHAYLFAGSRGVGKTSTARIFTKALNCLAPQDGEPCNDCHNCREITLDASPDVYEIDAASNRGIDNIRELRDNTKFTPAKCKFKTYIIDEVHMLTTESFNALLKTLEEPPPHIKFILATTAPHKIPETILSRCQRYDFHRISIQTMVEYLEQVVGEEEINLSREALELISRNAAGGMRDALTSIDQVVSFAGTAPTLEQVAETLGLMNEQEVLTLLRAVLDKSVDATLKTLGSILDQGHDLPVLLEAIIREIKDLTLFQTLEGKSTYFQDHSPATMEFYGEYQESPGLDELQQLFYLFLELESQLKQSEFNRACFEMALIKACRVTPLVGVPELLASVREAVKSPRSRNHPPQSEQRPQNIARPRSREGGSREAGGSGQKASGTDDGGEDGGPGPDHPASGARVLTATPEPSPVAEIKGKSDPLPSTQAPPNQAPGPQPPSPMQSRQEPSGKPPDNSPGIVSEAAPKTERLEGAGEPPPAQEEESEEVPSLDEEIPCEDVRWRAFIDAVKSGKPKLAAELRRLDVVSIKDEEVEIKHPDKGGVISEDELEILKEPFGAAFGEPFLLKVNHDTNRKVRYYYSLVGREQQIEDARLAAERDEAIANQTVQNVLNFFPNSRIEKVLPRQEQSPRRKDV